MSEIEILTESQMEYVAALCENVLEIAMHVSAYMIKNNQVIAPDRSHDVHQIIMHEAIALEARLPGIIDHDYYDHVDAAAELLVDALIENQMIIPDDRHASAKDIEKINKAVAQQKADYAISQALIDWQAQDGSIGIRIKIADWNAIKEFVQASREYEVTP